MASEAGHNYHNACSNATLPRAQAKTKVVEWDSVEWEHYKKVVEWGSLHEILAETSKLFFGLSGIA